MNATDAFFEFLRFVIDEGTLNRGLADALAGAGFDIEAAASGAQHDFMALWRGLLAHAQQQGEIRADIDMTDVKALLDGCLARQRGGPDPAARDRMIDILRQGLRPA
jgi:hypothetical protein